MASYVTRTGRWRGILKKGNRGRQGRRTEEQGGGRRETESERRRKERRGRKERRRRGREQRRKEARNTEGEARSTGRREVG